MIKTISVLIPFSLPWNWSADYERQTALALAKKGFKVIVYMHTEARFFLTMRLAQLPKLKNIIFYQPIYIFPFKRFVFVEKLNRWLNLLFLSHRYKKTKFVLWIFNPIFYLFPKILKGSTSVYDCVDFHGLNNHKEKKLIKSVDYFFVNSKTLKRLHIKERKGIVVPQGFALDIFKNPKQSQLKLSRTKPLIGFVGTIDYRLDFALLFKLIVNNPLFQFIFWGPINTDYGPTQVKEKIDKLLSLKNVTHGESKKEKVPTIIKQFDVGIIPYNLKIKANKYCYPMKLFEYFYVGKPVMATPIIELKRFPKFVKLARTPKQWQNHIKSLLAEPWPKKYQHQQKQLAIEGSWENKINQICNLIP